MSETLSWADRHRLMIRKRVAGELLDEAYRLYNEARWKDGRKKSIKVLHARGHAFEHAAFYLDPNLRYQAVEPEELRTARALPKAPAGDGAT